MDEQELMLLLQQMQQTQGLQGLQGLHQLGQMAGMHHMGSDMHGGMSMGMGNMDSFEGEILEFETPPNPDEVLSELMERFRYASNWRQQYDDRATEWFKLYVGWREQKDTGSNLHIPRVYEYLDTLRSRLVKSFVSQRPYVDFIPRVAPKGTLQDGQDNERKADIAAGLVDHQLELNDIVSTFYDHITNSLIFPAAIMGVGWKYEEKMVKRKVPIKAPVIDPNTGQVAINWEKAQAFIDPRTGQPAMDPRTGQPIPDPSTLEPLMQVVGTEVIEQKEVVYDDNEIINIDYYDFYPDPRGIDIDDCRFCFHREWMSRDEIESKIKLLAETGSGYIFEPDWDLLEDAAGEMLEEGRWERITSVGLQPETRAGGFSDNGGTGLYEVLNYWEDERHCIIINRTELIYDAPNPYWRHNKKPFVISSFEPLPNEFYGLSAVQLIEHLQHETNTHRNQRVDNVSMVLNRMWRVKRDSDVNEEDLVSRPNGIVWVENHDDVTDLAMNDVTGSSYNEENITKMDMENTLAVPSVVRGADSGRKETATEVVTKSTNAGMRFDIKIMLFESMGFKRLVNLLDLNNQQFIDDQRLIRMFGEGGEDWREVNAWEIVGEFDYRPAGSNVDPAANKEVRRQQLMQLLQVAVSTQTPYVDQGELWQSLVGSFDLRNTDKLIRSEEEVQQMQMQEMAMQQQAQMQAQQQHQQQLLMQQAGGGGDVGGGLPPQQQGGSPIMMGGG